MTKANSGICRAGRKKVLREGVMFLRPSVQMMVQEVLKAEIEEPKRR